MKGCLVPLWVVLVGTLQANGESITDFLRSRADLSQVNSCQSREISWGKVLQIQLVVEQTTDGSNSSVNRCSDL